MAKICVSVSFERHACFDTRTHTYTRTHTHTYIYVHTGKTTVVGPLLTLILADGDAMVLQASYLHTVSVHLFPTHALIHALASPLSSRDRVFIEFFYEEVLSFAHDLIFH